MRGDNHLLAVTTVKDEATETVKPLFSFPVQICKATAEQEAKLEVAAPSGARRKQVYVDPATGEILEDAECPRGVFLGDEFHPIPQEALDAIKDRTEIKTMVVSGKLPLTDVDVSRTTDLYFVQSPSKGGAPKAYRLLYDGLRAVKGAKKRPAMALVTKRTARSKQQLGVVYADEGLGCLVFRKLRFADSLRAPDEQVLAPSTAQVNEAQVEKVRQVIDALPDGKIALDTEYDESVVLKRELIEKAVEGEAIDTPIPVAQTAQTEDLEAALEASLAMT